MNTLLDEGHTSQTTTQILASTQVKQPDLHWLLMLFFKCKDKNSANQSMQAWNVMTKLHFKVGFHRVQKGFVLVLILIITWPDTYNTNVSTNVSNKTWETFSNWVMYSAFLKEELLMGNPFTKQGCFFEMPYSKPGVNWYWFVK